MQREDKDILSILRIFLFFFIFSEFLRAICIFNYSDRPTINFICLINIIFLSQIRYYLLIINILKWLGLWAWQSLMQKFCKQFCIIDKGWIFNSTNNLYMYTKR